MKANQLSDVVQKGGAPLLVQFMSRGSRTVNTKSGPRVVASYNVITMDGKFGRVDEWLPEGASVNMAPCPWPKGAMLIVHLRKMKLYGGLLELEGQLEPWEDAK